MGNKLNRLPVTFSKTGEVDGKETRFINITIDVLHTGDNLNGSTFSKEVVDRELESIKNTPILGYIEQNNAGDLDFKGHEYDIRIDEDGIKYVYAGSAYGVIPESCNPRWVNRDDGTGTMRDYLRVDGLLWTKFEDACDIFESDDVKAQSMEIKNLKGTVDDRGYYVVSDFDFDGCCILSTTNPSIRPAMTGSTAVANFSAETVAGEIKNMLDEYTALQKSQSSKEAEIDNFAKGEDVLEKKNEILANYGIDASTLDFSLEDVTIEELEEKCKAMSAMAIGPETAAQNTDIDNEPSQQFTLTDGQRREEICDAVTAEKYTDRWGDEWSRYWLQDIQENRAIVLDTQDWKTYALPFAMDGDNVKVDFDGKKRVKVVYEDWEEGSAESGLPVLYEKLCEKVDTAKGEVKKASEEYAEIKAQFDEMQPKFDAYVAAEAQAKKALESEKREKLFGIMDKQLDGVEEYSKLKKNEDMEFTALQDECYKLLGKKAATEFSYVVPKEKKGEIEKARFGVSGVQMKETEGKYGDLFERYMSR